MKVRPAGVSNYLIEDLKDILDTSDIVPAVNQVEFHPFLCQEQMLRFGNKNKIHLESCSPLTSKIHLLEARDSAIQIL